MQASVFTNPVFLVMAATIIVLLMVITGLAATIRNLAESGRQRIKKTGSLLPVLLAGLLGLLPASAPAQEIAEVVQDAGPVTDKWLPPLSVGGLDSFVFFPMLLFIIAEVLIIFGLIRSIRHILVGMGYKPAEAEQRKPLINWKWLDRKLTDAVPIGQEATVMTDHEYDGIRELDNNLPPWWKYGFYFTIVVAVVYLFTYHISRSAPLQHEEYLNELTAAEKQKKERLKEVAAAVDENTVILLTDAGLLAGGKDIYTGNCAACHGAGGEGGVGPNLTDEYWLHGGGINNIFKVIKYGIPEKGMISWKQQLNPEAIQKVASYIVTLQGTKPVKGKEPQGEVWKEAASASADTTGSTP